MSSLLSTSIRRTMSSTIQSTTPCSTAPLRVLISGSGIAGPCLAYWLTKIPHKTHVTVVERYPKPRTTGQAIDIHGAAVEIAKRMNILDDIKARNTTEAGCRMISPAGKMVCEFEVGGFLTNEYEILRGDLAELLMDASKRSEDVNYEFGNSITTLDQTKDEVTVSFANGETGIYDLVVAADGGASRTRDMFLDKSITKNSYSFVGQYIAYFTIPAEENDDLFGEWFGAPNGLGIMLRPHRTGNTRGAYLSITTPVKRTPIPEIEEALHKDVAAQKKVLRKYFENAGWQAKRVLAGMDAADDFYLSGNGRVRLPKWHNNRVIAIGDAAHAIMGVGTDLAIEAGYHLAGQLTKIKSAQDVPAALDEFEKEFRVIFNAMSGPDWGYPNALFPYTSWGLWLRNTLLKIAATTKVHRVFHKDKGDKVELLDYNWQGVD